MIVTSPCISSGGICVSILTASLGGTAGAIPSPRLNLTRSSGLMLNHIWLAAGALPRLSASNSFCCGVSLRNS